MRGRGRERKGRGRGKGEPPASATSATPQSNMPRPTDHDNDSDSDGKRALYEVFGSDLDSMSDDEPMHPVPNPVIPDKTDNPANGDAEPSKKRKVGDGSGELASAGKTDDKASNLQCGKSDLNAGGKRQRALRSDGQQSRRRDGAEDSDSKANTVGASGKNGAIESRVEIQQRPDEEMLPVNGDGIISDAELKSVGHADKINVHSKQFDPVANSTGVANGAETMPAAGTGATGEPQLMGNVEARKGASQQFAQGTGEPMASVERPSTQNYSTLDTIRRNNRLLHSLELEVKVIEAKRRKAEAEQQMASVEQRQLESTSRQDEAERRKQEFAQDEQRRISSEKLKALSWKLQELRQTAVVLYSVGMNAKAESLMERVVKIIEEDT